MYVHGAGAHRNDFKISAADDFPHGNGPRDNTHYRLFYLYLRIPQFPT